MEDSPDLFDQLDTDGQPLKSKAEVGVPESVAKPKKTRPAFGTVPASTIAAGKARPLEKGTTAQGAAPESTKQQPKDKPKEERVIVVRSDQEEMPVIEIADNSDDDLIKRPAVPGAKKSAPQVVSELTPGKNKSTGQALVRVGAKPGTAIVKHGSNVVRRKKRKKKKRIKLSTIAMTLGLAAVIFVFFLPKASTPVTKPVEIPQAAVPRIPTDASGQPLMLSGIPTPESGDYPVRVMAFLDIQDPSCMSCMMPLAQLRSWWSQDSTRRAVRVIVIGQDAVAAKKAKDMGIKAWPAVILSGPNGVRTLSGESALSDVFDSTRVVDGLASKVMGPPAKIQEEAGQ